jgi:hypothetical protein
LRGRPTVEVLQCAEATLGDIKTFVGEDHFYQDDKNVYVAYQENGIGRIDRLKTEHILVREGRVIKEVLLDRDFSKKYKII